MFLFDSDMSIDVLLSLVTFVKTRDCHLDMSTSLRQVDKNMLLSQDLMNSLYQLSFKFFFLFHVLN